MAGEHEAAGASDEGRYACTLVNGCVRSSEIGCSSPVGGGGIRSKRRRVQTRSKASGDAVLMQSAVVCIELDATLWPAESEWFTDECDAL